MSTRASEQQPDLGRTEPLAPRDEGRFLIAPFCAEDGTVHPDKVRKAYGLNRTQLMDLVGLARLVPSSSAPPAIRQDQRLRETLQVLLHAEEVFDDKPAVLAWFREKSVSALGQRTPEATVRAGHADLVHAFLDAVLSRSILP